MTREEIIKGLRCCTIILSDRKCDVCPVGFGEGCVLKLHQEAVKVLEQDAPETDADTISRQDAIKEVKDLPDCENGYSGTYDKATIIGVLEDLPSVKPKIPTGEWLDDESIGQYKCSECDNNAIDEYEFCPYCGADMRGEQK